jgi:hypothetical protein
MIPETVVREIEEKAIKEGVSVASILKERGIKVGRFYGAKKKYDRPSPPRLIPKQPEVFITKDLSLPECLTQLKTITENLNRIFRGL